MHSMLYDFSVENMTYWTNLSLPVTNGTESSTVVHCVSRQKPTFLVFCLFPGLAILINVVILAAVLRKARKLMRQSHVYAHVSSTLIGNALFSLLSLLQLLSLYFHFGGYPGDPDPLRRGMVNEDSSQWWTFHKSSLCGMFVIMCGNIGLLIDSIRHNTCSTLRTAAGHRTHQPESGGRWKRRLLTRRQRSYLLIVLLWVVPLIYAIVPVGGWNCRKTCDCLSECFPSNHVYTPSDFTCSRIFPPMANSWLAVVVASWLSGVIATIFLLKRSVQKVTKTWSQANSIKRDHQPQNDNTLARDQKKGLVNAKLETKDDECKADEPLETNTSSGINENSFSSEVFIEKETELRIADLERKGSGADNAGSGKVSAGNEVASDKTYFSVGNGEKTCTRAARVSESSFGTLIKSRGSGPQRRMMEHLRNTRASTFSLRYVIWLTFTFILCTTPTMALLSVDILNPNLVLNMIVLNSCLMCNFVYCYICPFILVKCLPGVKTSLSALILSVYSTTD